MEKVLEFLKSRSVAYYIAFASVLCGLIALIVYAAAGTNNFAPTLSASVIVPLVIGTVIGIFSMVKTYKLALLAQYVVYLYGFISVFIVNINLIANLLYNVDGSSVPASFFVIAIFALIATFGSLTAGIMTKYGQGGKRAPQEV